MARHFDGETEGSRRVVIVAGAVLGVAAVVAVAAWFAVKGSAKTEQANDAQVSEVATAADKAAVESGGDVADGAVVSNSGAFTAATETVTATSTTTTQTTSSLSPLSIDNDVPADGESSSDSDSDSNTTVDPTPSNNAQVNNGTASTGLSAGAPDNDVVVE